MVGPIFFTKRRKIMNVQLTVEMLFNIPPDTALTVDNFDEWATYHLEGGMLTKENPLFDEPFDPSVFIKESRVVES